MVWRGQSFIWLFAFGTTSFCAFSSSLFLTSGKALVTLWRRAGRGLGRLFILIPSSTREILISYCFGCSCLALGSEPRKCFWVAGPAAR